MTCAPGEFGGGSGSGHDAYEVGAEIMPLKHTALFVGWRWWGVDAEYHGFPWGSKTSNLEFKMSGFAVGLHIKL